jgi:NitT/TauT family transport system substrate-binding protein
VKQHRMDRAAFLAGTAAAVAAPSIVRAATPLRVGIVSGDGAATAYYAQQLGYFKNNGLDVDLQVLGSGAAIAAALAGNGIDAGSVNCGSLASARLRGIPLRAIAPLAIIDHPPIGDALVVAKASLIRTGADLNGKTVATNALGTMQHAGAMSWIDAHGGDAKSVKFVEMNLSAMSAAVAAGRIDAAICSEPFTTLAVAENRSLGALYDGMRKPFLILAMCATEPWLAANSATATKFVSAIRQANAWSQAPANDKQRRAYNVALTKIDPDVGAKMSLWQMGSTLDPGMIQPVIDTMVKYGFLERPVNPADLIWKAP